MITFKDSIVLKQEYINELGEDINNRLRLNINYKTIDIDNVLLANSLIKLEDFINKYYVNIEKEQIEDIVLLNILFKDLKEFSPHTDKPFEFAEGRLDANGNYILDNNIEELIDPSSRKLLLNNRYIRLNNKQLVLYSYQ